MIKKLMILGAISVIIFCCFSYSLQNQFTNWDDDFYVTNVDYIKSLTPNNLRIIFSDGLIIKNKYQPNYHPLCMLSLAINYHFAGLNPWSYYLTNIIIHIINAILVFFLFIGLCRLLKTDENGQLLVASLGALWFGIHPMHVESVSWVAERKDVLYTFFYLLGLLAYLRFYTSQKALWFWTTFILFVASCLSKPMAVVFPLSLVCIDFLLQRKLSIKLVVEKSAFFLAALAFGIIALYTQNKTGAIAAFGVLTIQERIMYASYGFVMYITKLFNPSYLSTFYPYPFRFITGYLHSFFYAAPFLAIGLFAAPLLITYKYYRPYFRIAVFGMGFFLSNVIFVLQFISVGAAIMADRYSYVAYIGIFFLLGYFCNELIKKYPSARVAVLLVLALCSAGLAKACYDRTGVWHDAESLLTDGIEKYPFKKDPDRQYDRINSGIAGLSYKWRGNYYFHKNLYDQSLEDFKVLSMLRQTDEFVEGKIAHMNAVKSGAPDVSEVSGANMAPAPGNRGALPMMPSGPKLPTGNFKAYLDSSYYFAHRGDTLKAFRTYINAFRFNQGVERLYADSSFKAVQNKQFDVAINQYGVIMKINTGNPYYYFYRGVAWFSKNKMKIAIEDWETALKMNSKEIKQSASYNLSVAYDSVGKDSLAVYYAEMAKNSGYTVNEDFLNKLRAKKAAQRRK